MEPCKGGVEKMGGCRQQSKDQNLTGLKSSSFPRVLHDQSSNCGSSVKAGIVRAFYRQARRVGIGLPWRWSGHVCLR